MLKIESYFLLQNVNNNKKIKQQHILVKLIIHQSALNHLKQITDRYINKFDRYYIR